MTLQPPPDEAPILLPLPPEPNPNRFRFLLDHNPCFILSGLLMFLGCYLINSALDVRTGDTGKLLELLAAINCYEVALLLLGITLLHRAAWHRDGVLLLLIQMLFLADAPFLLAQIALAKQDWLSTFNIILFLLAIAKVAFAFKGLKLPLRPQTLGFLILQLALIYGILPLFFAHASTDGILPAAPMYLTWWLVGLLPLAYDLLARIDPLPSDSGPHKFVRRAYIIVPWLLLIAHLGFFQWVYRAPYVAADLSPILIGLSIATLRLRPTTFLPRRELVLLRVVLPAIAFFLSLPTDPMQWVPFHIPLILNPIPITASLALISCAYCINLRTAFATILLLGCAALAYYYAAILTRLAHASANTSDRTLHFFVSLLPRSPIAWGILTISAAFALLALGAYGTLHHPTSKTTAP